MAGTTALVVDSAYRKRAPYPGPGLQPMIDNARKLRELVAELEILALDNLDEDPPTARP